MISRKQAVQALDRIGVWEFFARFYRLGMAIRYAGTFSEAIRAFGTYLSPKYVERMAPLSAMRDAQVQLSQGIVDRALGELAEIAYGPAQEPFVRRNALNVLLAWGHTTANAELAVASANHIFGGFGLRRPPRVLPSELALLLENYSQRDWEKPAAYQAFLAANLHSHKTLDYATANFAFGVQPELYGTQALRRVQLAWLTQLMRNHGLTGFADGNPAAGQLTLDDLAQVAVAPPAVKTGPLVTVLMPVFNGAEWIGTALDGLVKQTWRNLEVIVIDDCSTDNTREVVASWGERDSRIKLIQAERNGGSYRARNLGVDAARGEFITVHDADDWSHPQKIEIQARQLLESPSTVANTTEAVRIESDNLHFYPAVGRRYLRKNFSSLMFRRERVHADLGYWDEVRFGADSEFYERLVAKYGKRAVKDLKAGPLSLVRYHSASLTGTGYSSMQLGMNGIRRYYSDSFKDWHARIRNGKESGWLGRNPATRPFPVAGLQLDRNFKYEKFDLVLVSDLSESSEQLPTVRRLIGEAVGKRVGLVHAVPTVLSDPSVAAGLRKLVDFEAVSMLVPGDEAMAVETLVLDPACLFSLDQLHPLVASDSVILIGTPEPTVSERAAAEFGGQIHWRNQA